MRTALLFIALLFTTSGCAICDRDGDGDGDDLPRRPGLFERGARDLNDPDAPPRFHWFGPSKEAPGINPPIPELPPQREFTAPRAEDPSWRNR